MNNEQLYDAVIERLDPLSELINSIEDENQYQMTATFCIMALLGRFTEIEALGALERAQHLIIERRKDLLKDKEVKESGNPFLV